MASTPRPTWRLAWPKSGPALIWKKDVGQGFSGPVVANGKLILFHRVGDSEVVECLNALTGQRIWSTESPTRYRDDFGFDEGPRGTPTIAAGRVVTCGAEGMLQSLDFATGKRIWSVDTRAKFGFPKGYFGAACTPLVDGDRVLVNVGGPNGAGIVAFDAATGKILWTATNDEAGYSAPVAATLGGVRHALFLTRNGVVDLDPANGKVRFQFPWRSRNNASVNAAAPLLIGDLLFVSASYGAGAGVFQIDGANAKKLWASDDALSNHYATSVYHDGYLYGYHGRQEYGPSLRAVELKTGKVAWSVDDFKAGTITLAAGLPAGSARRRRADVGAGVAQRIPAGGESASAAGNRALVSGHRRRADLYTERENAGLSGFAEAVTWRHDSPHCRHSPLHFRHVVCLDRRLCTLFRIRDLAG